MRRSRFGGLIAWVGLLVSLVFMYFAFRGIDLGDIRRALGESNWWALLPAVAVLAVAIIIRVIRWRILFPLEWRPSTRNTTNAMLIGYLFNSILPARGGEVVRVLALNQRAGTPRFVAFGTVVAERAIDVLVLLGLLFIVSPTLPSADWLPRALGLSALLFGATVVLFVAFALYGERPARFVLRPLSLLPRMSRDRTELAAANLVRGFAVFRRAAIAVPAFTLTAVSWVLIALASWICMKGFHLEIGFSAAILVVISVNLAMILPSGPAGLGVFEAATIVALLPYDVDRPTALSYALVLHALNVFPFIIVGFIALQSHTLAVRRARAASADVAGSHERAAMPG
jgi:glycosyltransferase 2 family protein